MDEPKPLPTSIVIPARLLEAIERERLRMEATMPGIKLSRTDTILALIERGLKGAGK